MVLQWLCRRHLARSRTSLARVGHLRCSNRQYATAAQDSKRSALSLTRNIGIIAHIDAVSNTVDDSRVDLSSHNSTGQDNNDRAMFVLRQFYAQDRRLVVMSNVGPVLFVFCMISGVR